MIEVKCVNLRGESNAHTSDPKTRSNRDSSGGDSRTSLQTEKLGDFRESNPRLVSTTEWALASPRCRAGRFRACTKTGEEPILCKIPIKLCLTTSYIYDRKARELVRGVARCLLA